MQKFRTWPLAILTLCCFSPLRAETIEEIVVTADLLERPLQEIASSITLLDADAIDTLADQHFGELVKSIPNLTFSGDGNRARYFQIRGVGELEQYEGAPNPSVGFLIDDIDFSGIGTVATLFDIDRVEVLRGPQGSRYGANALGGLIYLKSTEPTAETSGHTELSLADDDTWFAAAAFGGALAESGSVMLRLSAQHYESDGFRENATLDRDDTNGRRESGARLKLRWLASDDLEATATVMLSDIDNGYDAFALDNSFTTLSDKPGRDAQESVGAALNVDWGGLDFANLESITTFADSDIVFSFDADWGSAGSWAPFVYDFTSLADRQRKTLSQEFRLTSTRPVFGATTDWLVGVYAQRLDEQLLTVNLGEYVDPVFDFSLGLDDRFESDYTAENIALFGQLETQLGRSTRLTTGLRVERRRVDYSDSNALSAAPEETMTGGDISLSRDLSDGVIAYAGLALGFKAGGFNLGVVPDGRREFEQERLWNVELGIKADFRSLGVNAAIFYNRRDDQQVRTSQQLIPNDPASFVFFTDNAARGRSYGAELEADWAISRRWSLSAAIGLLSAEIDDFEGPQAALTGREQAHAPGYTASAGLRYRGERGFFADLNLSAVDAFYFDVSHDQRSSAYEVVGLRAGFAADAWTLTAWARNLFDERYAVRGFFFGNEPPDFAPELYTRSGDPRHVGVTINWRF